MSARAEKLRTPAPPVKEKASRPAVAFWRRPLGATVFFGIPAVLLLVLVAVGYPMIVEARREAPERISPRQLVEFQQKKKALRNARALSKAGKYERSIAAYDAYLKKYPYSTAARDGRAAARSALEQSAPSTVRAARRQPASSADRDKPSLRNRMRRIFRRDRS